MKFGNNSFLKSVSVLISGTILAQVISLAFSPIISRIYGPEENAYLGLFLKIVTIVATLSTARLELAIPTQKNRQNAFGIYHFSFYLTVVISLSILFLVILSSFFTLNYYKLEISVFLVLIPIGVFLVSFYNLGTNWALRNEEYGQISKSSIVLSLSSNLFRLTGYFFGAHFLILIVSTILAYILASFNFFKKFRTLLKAKLTNYKSLRTKYLVKQNKDFYTFNLYHVLLDLSREMLIIGFIWIYFSKEEYGSYEFSFRMLKLPVVFFSMAMSQVFYRKASELVENRSGLLKMTIKTIVISLGIGVLPFLAIYFFGEELFSFVFGNKWIEAGTISEFLTPWIFLQFVFTPVSFLPILLKKQKAYFWINLVMVCLMIIFGFIIYLFKLDFHIFMMSLNWFSAVFLVLLICWFIFIIKVKED